jgi:two-component system, OmpR family, sensor histidine kinase VicK
VVRKILQFISNTKSKFDACIDHTRPSLAVEIEGVKDSLLDARNRGIRIRFITEINKDNISYCKELITFVDELRHLGGIKGSFYINDLGYLVPTEFHDKGSLPLK